MLNARKSRIAWVLFLSLFYIIIQLPSLLDNHKTLVVLLAIVGGLQVYRLLRRQDTRHPGQVQVRLSKAGFTQYDDLNGLNAVEQLGKSYGWTLLSGATVVLGAMIVRDRSNSIVYWGWFVVGLILSIVSMFRSRNYSRKMRHVPPGGIAEANRAFHPVRAWELAKEWSLIGLAAQKFRIQVDVANMRHFSEREEVVDAEIQCTTEQAAYLRQQITEWIAVAKRKDNHKSAMADSTKSPLTQ